MVKNIFKIVIFFFFGMIGGIFATQILWPYLVENPLFLKYSFNNKNFFSPTTSVIEKKEVIIQKNSVLEEAVKKVNKTIVGIKIKTKEGKTNTGSGIIITNDGLLVTLSELIPKNSECTLFINGRPFFEYQILKRDQKENLVLIKIKAENNDIQATAFADFDEVELGEQVFLMGVIFSDLTPFEMVNQGIIKYFNTDSIVTNILEKHLSKGSPLFNLNGELLGLTAVNSDGEIVVIPVVKIRRFIGF